MDGVTQDDAGPQDPGLVDGDDRVYLVPYRWWKESQEPESESDGLNVTRGILYIASPAASLYGGPMRLINNIFNSDLAFNLRRDDGSTTDDAVEGDLGRTYALIPNYMWSQALRWHNETTNEESMFAENEDVDVYHLKLRIGVIRETSRMTVKISKKDNAVESYKRACKIFSVDSDVLRIFDFSGRTNLILMNDWNRLSGDGQRISDQELFFI